MTDLISLPTGPYEANEGTARVFSLSEMDLPRNKATNERHEMPATEQSWRFSNVNEKMKLFKRT